MVRLLSALIFSWMVVCAFGQLDPTTKALVNNMVSMMDTTANPCSDFYQYSCGGFIKNNPIPANKSASPYFYNPSFSGIAVINDNMLDSIVHEDLPLISDLFESCMVPNDTVFYDMKKTVLNLRDKILKTDYVNNPQEFVSMVAWLALQGIEAFIHFQAGQIITPANTVIEYYPSDQWAEYLTTLATQTFGLDPASAKMAVALDIEVEQWVLKYKTDSDIEFYRVSQLNNVTGFDFKLLFDDMGLEWPADLEVSLFKPSYYQNLTRIGKIFTNDHIQQYFIIQIMSNAVSYSPSVCWDPNISPFAAELVCGWIEEYAPSPAPWSQETVCKYYVNYLLGDYVGLLFSDRVVSEDVKNDIIDLTTGIQKAFGSNLQNLTWLDATSRSSVVDKLQHIIQIIGHPNHLEKYEGVITTPDSLQTNIYAIVEAVTRWNYNNLDHNRTDFEFPPLIVNAFYSPNTNTINFPAGILESPMFSASWPKLFQYARLGYVVGHENTHGFDNDGSHYGPDGLPADIFDESTREKFNANTKCISDYYSTFRVYSNGTANVTVDGVNTLGENIADIGGVKNSRRAYDAYVKANGREFFDGELIPGFTTDQVFLIFQGQTWCSVTNDAYLKLQVQYDVHSPSKWRVNGPLSQEDEFAAAFKCPLGSPMNPKDKCNVW